MMGTSRVIRYVFLVGVAVLLAACGGPAVDVPSLCPQGGCISGIVVDSNDKPIPDMWLTAGGKATQSSSSGSFLLTSVASGTHHLRGSGGTADHYVLDVPGVSVSTGQVADIGKKTAYQVFGMLIVEESLVSQEGHLDLTPLGLRAGNGDRSIKLPYEGTLRRQTTGANLEGVELTAAGGEALIDEYGGYFYLAWERDEGLPDYSIEYMGTSEYLGTIPTGTGEVIWTSDEESDKWDPNDPPFDHLSPAAYLDLDFELSDVEREVGKVYYFKITTPHRQYPPIALSLASRVTEFAGNLRIEGSGSSRTFAWDEVSGADGYQVLVYTDDGQKVWDSGGDLLDTPEVSASAANLNPGTYYRWYVDAHFLGDNGWVAEIARTSSGLIW